MKSPRTTPFIPTLACLGAALAFVASASAGSRHFAYSYETTTMAKGAMELESSVTWKTDQEGDTDTESFDIRHEFEFGVTDRLQLAFYFADWSHAKTSGKSSRTKFEDIAVEAIYNLTDPNTSPFGSAIYGELKGSDDFIELEGKILLQKNIGPWMFVYNSGGEIAWEDDYSTREAELMQSIGVACQLNPSWSLGTEFLHEIAVPDANTLGDSGVYLGPNLSWRNRNFSATVTGLWQLTSVPGEPGFQIRTIFSFDF